MKVSRVAHGRVTTIELRVEDGRTFETVVPKQAEAMIVFSSDSSEAVLRIDDRAWTVKGHDRHHETQLRELRERSAPRLAWVAGVFPATSDTERLVLAVHEFPFEYHWPDPFVIGVTSETVVAAQKHARQTVVDIPAAIKWLTQRMLLPPAFGTDSTDTASTPTGALPARALFVGMPPAAGAAPRGGFRLLGGSFAVDVIRADDDRLMVRRVVELHGPVDGDEKRPIFLAHGSFGFALKVDPLRVAMSSQLEEIVKQSSGSYLNLWNRYNELERERIFERARTFSWHRYDSRRPRGDGWVLKLTKPDEFATALTTIQDSGFELEAAEEPPDDLVGTSPSGSSDGAPQPKAFSGKFEAFRDGRLFLRARDDEGEGPPASGFVFVALGGDRPRLERRKRARDEIARAEGPMPQLGLILEGKPAPAVRRTVEPLSAAARARFRAEPTARQIDALKIALSTPDVALIQGPPGTGKTEVIAALQVRLAEVAASDAGVSGLTLLTSYQHEAVENAAGRTEVFGLPARKVGRRRGETLAEDSSIEQWRQERIERVRATLETYPKRPATTALKQTRVLVAGFLTSPTSRTEATRVLQEVAERASAHVSPGLVQRLHAMRDQLNRATIPSLEGEDREAALVAARALRVEALGFEDDGPRNAHRLVRRMEALPGAISAEERDLLARAVAWREADVPPPFLADLRRLKEGLIDRLQSQGRSTVPDVPVEVADLLNETIAELHRRTRQTAAGEVGVLEDYLNDLENDVGGVEDAVENYTVVQAATCQQAVGRDMQGLKEGLVWENVVVDEAARANPLDLFIPMARAKRRIILVGDHRQLPHVLEPDVERELTTVTAEVQEALGESLFERLFKDLKAREARDGITRTVTLNVQFRMHSVLASFVSRTFYEPFGEAFTSGRADIDFPTDVRGFEGRVAAWVDVPAHLGREQRGRSKRRDVEAREIASRVADVAQAHPELTIGVIAFYSAQVDALHEALEKVGVADRDEDGVHQIAPSYRNRVRVGSVDSFQGREFDIVFLSLVRSNDLPHEGPDAARRKYGFLTIENRLCVAMSRQRRLLVVVGDAAMFQGAAASTHVRGLTEFCTLTGGGIHGVRLQSR